MMAAFMSEHTNPTLYKEMQDEFEADFKACAKSNPERVNESEFCNLMDKTDMMAKKRFGEAVSGDEMERKMWFTAYNKLTPESEGVSLMDFKLGDAVMQTIMFREQLMPLVKKMMKRMMTLRPETR
jgi:hypothetical protein